MVDGQLHGDPSLDRHLVEVTRASVLHLFLPFIAPFALVDWLISTLLQIWIASTDLFFDLPLQLALIDVLSQLAGEPATCGVQLSVGRKHLVVATVEGLVGAPDQLVPRLASDERLRGQNARLVL